MPTRDPQRPPIVPRVEPLAAPPSMAAPARRRRVRTRGGGWLLPGPRPPAETTPDPRRPADNGTALRAPGEIAIERIEQAGDVRSPLDQSRWVRLRAEARRWTSAPEGQG